MHFYKNSGLRFLIGGFVSLKEWGEWVSYAAGSHLHARTRLEKLGKMIGLDSFFREFSSCCTFRSARAQLQHCCVGLWSLTLTCVRRLFCFFFRFIPIRFVYSIMFLWLYVTEKKKNNKVAAVPNTKWEWEVVIFYLFILLCVQLGDDQCVLTRSNDQKISLALLNDLKHDCMLKMLI